LVAFFFAAFFFLAIGWLLCASRGCRREESLRDGTRLQRYLYLYRHDL
jgi:hypothetical protein